MYLHWKNPGVSTTLNLSFFFFLSFFFLVFKLSAMLNGAAVEDGEWWVASGDTRVDVCRAYLGT